LPQAGQSSSDRSRRCATLLAQPVRPAGRPRGAAPSLPNDPERRLDRKADIGSSRHAISIHGFTMAYFELVGNKTLSKPSLYF